MYCYLSKKIGIPNSQQINCIAWHKIEGFIAVGGDKGLLKVLKLDSGGQITSGNTTGKHGASATTTAIASASGAASGTQWSRNEILPSNLSMNLTLEGHTEPVEVIVWNENLDKLTTSDRNGVIIVWMLYKGIWYEEMINNRNKSTVTGMAWSYDGSKICIVYEDGAVIVGAANGNRIWGKELKKVNLRGVQWSPDASMLLFSTSKSELHLYDYQGNFMMNIINYNSLTPNLPLDINHDDNVTIPSSGAEIVALQWYDGRYGYYGQNCPVILICYRNGDVCLMHDINDESPVLFSVPNATICFAAWNHNASMIAIGAECHIFNQTGKYFGERRSILFYDNDGKLLQLLKLPGSSMTGCAWEGASLRLAITIDTHIFFANIHPRYKWTYFHRTLAFSTGLWTTNGICITFWDTHSNLINTLYVNTLYCITSYGNLCAMALKFVHTGSYMLVLCDTGGTIVNEKTISLRPSFITMNSSFVIVTSNIQFLLWQYNNLRSNQIHIRNKREYIYHISERVTGEEALLNQEDDSNRDGRILYSKKPETLDDSINILNDDTADDPTNSTNASNDDDIQCITCSESILLIGRKNGTVNHYELPHVSLVNKYTLTSTSKGISQIIRINCNSTKAAVVTDGQLIEIMLRSDPGFMRGEFVDAENTSESNGGRLERRDVWDICWAIDNPHMLAVMEKSRLYVFRGTNPEEPITCSGYICCFKDLEIKTALLDEIIANPDNLHKNLIVDREVKSLRDTRELLNKVGIKEARQFIVDNPHPRLWRLLAEAALKQLDLITAEIGYVYCQDLAGIEFINQLNRNRNQSLVKAEIATYTKDFDEAERLYMECDRRDLVLELYKKLGDWFKVRQLMTPSMKADVMKIKEIYNGIGNYYADRYNWVNAREYFSKSQNNDMLSICYYYLENYDALEKLTGETSRKDPLLLKIGDLLMSVGLCAAATNAYVKYGEIEKAVTLCTKQNEWELAVNLAKEHEIRDVDKVLSEYVNRLIEDKRLPQAIELYKKTNRYLEAAILAFDYGKELSKTTKDIIKIKNWFVAAAMLIDKHRKENSGINAPKFDDLIMNRWRYALAYHLYGIAQKHLYENNLKGTFITMMKLREFDDIIAVKDIYTILAVTSRGCQLYAVCAKAYVKIISCPQISESDKERYRNMANEIFKSHVPKDKQISRKECVNCEVLIPDWYYVCPSCDVKFPTCLITGQPLMDPKSIWTCSNCLQNADIYEIASRKTCPLCSTLKVSN